ncbi:hypothetical protein FNF28_02337 [Cafeteria roenbergensis]|uniref:DNA topoisomerase n=2 Tax=Cafeteria roenbergensis TaxID=33653 RepID=A0A5A8DYB7_CAFRO|nr:hypothetical protein FNF28_02337 [Cafeteria roenbergensis]
MPTRVLNVAEKNSVAKAIVEQLSPSRRPDKRVNGDYKYCPIYYFRCSLAALGGDCDMAMTSVSGHLMEINFPAHFRNWAAMDPGDLFAAPIQATVSTRLKPLQRQLRRLARDADVLVLWTDCDREGEAIACEVRDVCRSAKRGLQVLRARFSAITGGAIRAAVMPGALVPPDQLQADAVMARQVLDLRIGATFTRFLTLLMRRALPGHFGRTERGGGGASTLVSYGPCQFPTLGFIVDRYLQRAMFRPEPFWAITLHVSPAAPAGHGPGAAAAAAAGAAATGSAPAGAAGSEEASLTWCRGRTFDKMTALCLADEAADAVQSGRCTVEAVDRRVQTKRKPLPLTTVELQKRAARWLRLSASATASAAEALYQKGIISYPRTETDSFPADFAFVDHLRDHEGHLQWGPFTSRLVRGEFRPPRCGKHMDNAHSPIYPTKCKLPSEIEDATQRKVYELVCRHFVACCAQDATGDLRTVRVRAGSESFRGSGLVVTDRGYLDVYPWERWSSRSLPDLGPPGTTLGSERAKVGVSGGETTAPELLTESDLIATMDKEGIGTDATIAEHIKTIVARSYAVQTAGSPARFAPTTLGTALVWGFARLRVPMYRPFLRRNMEADLEEVCRGSKTKDAIVEACIAEMQPLYTQIKGAKDTLVGAVRTFLEGGGAGAVKEIENFARREARRRDGERADGGAAQATDLGIELARARAIAGLRTAAKELVAAAKPGARLPAGAFDKWLFTALLAEATSDSVRKSTKTMRRRARAATAKGGAAANGREVDADPVIPRTVRPRTDNGDLKAVISALGIDEARSGTIVSDLCRAAARAADAVDKANRTGPLVSAPNAGAGGLRIEWEGSSRDEDGKPAVLCVVPALCPDAAIAAAKAEAAAEEAIAAAREALLAAAEGQGDDGDGDDDGDDDEEEEDEDDDEGDDDEGDDDAGDDEEEEEEEGHEGGEAAGSSSADEDEDEAEEDSDGGSDSAGGAAAKSAIDGFYCARTAKPVSAAAAAASAASERKAKAERGAEAARRAVEDATAGLPSPWMLDPSDGAGAISPCVLAPPAAVALSVCRGKTRLRLNPAHYRKLGELYARGPGRMHPWKFHERLFLVLLRYHGEQGGGGFQAAAHGEVFDALRDHCGADMECFASPLNCRFAPFCSAYPDTDLWFGGAGSFFSLDAGAGGGSFEANPPFVPAVLNRMQESMETALVRCEEPLSFAVIIPAWDGTTGWRGLAESPHLRASFTLAQREHGYLEGSQHWRRTSFRVSTCDTTVFILQNDAGAERWAFSKDAEASVRAAFASRHTTLAAKREAKAARRAAKRPRDEEAGGAAAAPPRRRALA